MTQSTGGIVKMDEVHRIGEEGCLCYYPGLALGDPDYRSDVEGIIGKPLVIHPVKTDMTDEELAELIRKDLEMMIRIQELFL